MPEADQNEAQFSQAGVISLRPRIGEFLPARTFLDPDAPLAEPKRPDIVRPGASEQSDLLYDKSLESLLSTLKGGYPTPTEDQKYFLKAVSPIVVADSQRWDGDYSKSYARALLATEQTETERHLPEASFTTTRQISLDDDNIVAYQLAVERNAKTPICSSVTDWCVRIEQISYRNGSDQIVIDITNRPLLLEFISVQDSAYFNSEKGVLVRGHSFGSHPTTHFLDIHGGVARPQLQELFRMNKVRLEGKFRSNNGILLLDEEQTKEAFELIASKIENGLRVPPLHKPPGEAYLPKAHIRNRAPCYC